MFRQAVKWFLVPILILMTSSATFAAAFNPPSIRMFPNDPLFANTWLPEEFYGPFLGPVKSVTIRSGENFWRVRFSPEGKPLQRDVFLTKLQSNTVIFDDKGRSLRYIGNSPQGLILTSLHYDETTHTVRTQGGVGTLDSNGRVIRFNNDRGFILECEYNKAGLLVKKTTIYPSHELTDHFTYDKNGRLIMYTNSGTSSAIKIPHVITKKQFFYDTQGRLAQYSNDSRVYPVEEEQDEVGNWTKRTIFYSAVNVTLTYTQEIEYYQ